MTRPWAQAGPPAGRTSWGSSGLPRVARTTQAATLRKAGVPALGAAGPGPAWDLVFGAAIGSSVLGGVPKGCALAPTAMSPPRARQAELGPLLPLTETASAGGGDGAADGKGLVSPWVSGLMAGTVCGCRCRRPSLSLAPIAWGRLAQAWPCWEFPH